MNSQLLVFAEISCLTESQEEGHEFSQLLFIFLGKVPIQSVLQILIT